MIVFGNGRAALLGDAAMAERLGWPRRKRSLAEPELLLTPVEGDPRFEPWIARKRLASTVEGLWKRPAAGPEWTYLKDTAGLPKYLERLAAPKRDRELVVGITGLGRVGGLAAGALSTVARRHSRIGTLLIHDADASNQERWRLELGSVACWGEPDALPQVEAVSLAEMFLRCDAVLFAAAAWVPPLEATGDMRLPQFPGNRAILQEALQEAARADYSGLFLMVSDPVECLAQASFHDSNRDAEGAFTGLGLAPERIAGLALGVMWGRALCAARAEGRESGVRATGLPLGPHSTEVLVYDDPQSPDLALCRHMNDAARYGNLRVRELGYLPYVGPALSSIVLALPRLFAGKDILASSFLGGLYFGAPARLDWGLVPRPQRLGPVAQKEVHALHALLQKRMERLGTAFHP